MLYFLVIPLVILLLAFIVCFIIDMKHVNKFKIENELFNDIMCNINKGYIVRIDGDTIVVNCSGDHWSVFTYYEEYGLSFKTYNIIKINSVTVWKYDQSVLSSKNMKLLKEFVKRAKAKQKKDKCFRYKDTLSKINDDNLS